MSPIDFGLGPDVVIRGAVYDSMDPVCLREDLAEIDLPTGETISISWEPNEDPEGEFRVVAFRDYWSHSVMKATTKNLDGLEFIVRTMCFSLRGSHEQPARIFKMDVFDDSGVPC